MGSCCSSASPKLICVTILHVDHSLEDLQKPADFFTQKWLTEQLGSHTIQAQPLDPTRDILFAVDVSKFQNDNATHFLRISKVARKKCVIFGRALLVPHSLAFPPS